MQILWSKFSKRKRKSKSIDEPLYLHKVNEHVDQGNYDEDFEEYKHRMLQSLQAHDSFKSNLSGVQSALLEHGPARSDDEINVISNWLHQYRFFVAINFSIS